MLRSCFVKRRSEELDSGSPFQTSSVSSYERGAYLLTNSIGLLEGVLEQLCFQSKCLSYE